MTDDLMALADAVFETPARRDPVEARSGLPSAVAPSGGPVPNVPAVHARDEGRAGGAVGAASFSLPAPPPFVIGEGPLYDPLIGGAR